MILQPQIPVEQQSIQSPGSPLWGLWQKCHCAFSKKPIYCSAGAWLYIWECFQRKNGPKIILLSSIFLPLFSLNICNMTVFFFGRYQTISFVWFDFQRQRGGDMTHSMQSARNMSGCFHLKPQFQIKKKPTISSEEEKSGKMAKKTTSWLIFSKPVGAKARVVLED